MMSEIERALYEEVKAGTFKELQGKIPTLEKTLPKFALFLHYLKSVPFYKTLDEIEYEAVAGLTEGKTISQYKEEFEGQINGFRENLKPYLSIREYIESVAYEKATEPAKEIVRRAKYDALGQIQNEYPLVTGLILSSEELNDKINEVESLFKNYIEEAKTYHNLRKLYNMDNIKDELNMLDVELLIERRGVIERYKPARENLYKSLHDLYDILSKPSARTVQVLPQPPAPQPAPTPQQAPQPQPPQPQPAPTPQQAPQPQPPQPQPAPTPQQAPQPQPPQPQPAPTPQQAQPQKVPWYKKILKLLSRPYLHRDPRVDEDHYGILYAG